jgi:hypothetical protein
MKTEKDMDGIIHKLSGKRLITIWEASLSEAIPLIILDSEKNTR